MCGDNDMFVMAWDGDLQPIRYYLTSIIMRLLTSNHLLFFLMIKLFVVENFWAGTYKVGFWDYTFSYYIKPQIKENKYIVNGHSKENFALEELMQIVGPNGHLCHIRRTV